MFKTIWLMKRKDGMSKEEFVEYYEAKHRVLAEQYMSSSTPVHYLRRYLYAITPGQNDNWDKGPEPVYDVMTEVWFADRAAWEEHFARFDPETAREILADEENLFDRDSIVQYTVDEYVSTLDSHEGTDVVI